MPVSVRFPDGALLQAALLQNGAGVERSLGGGNDGIGVLGHGVELAPGDHGAGVSAPLVMLGDDGLELVPHRALQIGVAGVLVHDEPDRPQTHPAASGSG